VLNVFENTNIATLILTHTTLFFIENCAHQVSVNHFENSSSFSYTVDKVGKKAQLWYDSYHVKKAL